MQGLYQVVTHLTSQFIAENDKARMLNDFAYSLGWRPSDRLVIPSVSDFVNAHLVVEHGLENSAVISFLRSPRRFSDLGFDEKNRLLNISYNTMVDWHLQIQSEEVYYVYNRADPPLVVERQYFSRDYLEPLRSETFEQITGKRIHPNVPSLDDALLRTISLWRRNLAADFSIANADAALSSLFNAIIFVRAVEDHYTRQNPTNGIVQRSQGLLDTLRALGNNATLRKVVRDSLNHFQIKSIPSYIIDINILQVYDVLDQATLYSLFVDFYRNKFAPYYEYDFSIISRHALSQIYEQYVSILQPEEGSSGQLAFIPSLPSEQRRKATGSMYTPQFIARFFSMLRLLDLVNLRLSPNGANQREIEVEIDNIAAELYGLSSIEREALGMEG